MRPFRTYLTRSHGATGCYPDSYPGGEGATYAGNSAANIGAVSMARAYPEAFVKALTEPRPGSGLNIAASIILEEVNHTTWRCTRRCTPWYGVRAWFAEQKRRHPPKIATGELRYSPSE
jgi:hypothetical protein